MGVTEQTSSQEESMVAVLVDMCRGDCKACQIRLICRAILRWNKPKAEYIKE